MDWINVTEKLPANNREVLIFSNIGISIGVYDLSLTYLKKPAFYDLQMWSDLWGYEEDETVTHWMELPTKPI